MTIKLTSLKADLAREEEGDWVEFPDWGGGVAFRVSSINKGAFQIARGQLFQRLARKHKGKTPPNLLTSELGKLYAEHILHDWRGLDVAYSPEKAMEVLSDPAFREVVRAVEWCAGEIGAVDAEFLEDAGKNSAPPSGGGSKDGARTTG